MSEFVAVGPARNLDGPLPLERPHSLLQDSGGDGGRLASSARVTSG